MPRSGSKGPEPNEDLGLSRALSLERADQHSFTGTSPSRGHSKGDPFACLVAPKDLPPPAEQEPATLELEDLPEAVQNLIIRAITHDIAAGIQEHQSASLASESLHSQHTRISSSASLTGFPQRSPTRSRASADLFLEEEERRDNDLSDDLFLPQ